MKGEQVDHFDVRAPTNIEPLDDVDALELRVAVRDRRQVPSPRRRGPAHPPAGIEHAAPLENPADRAHRRHPDHVPGQQVGSDDGGAKLPEVAGVPQFLSHLQHQILKGPWGARGPARPRGPIGPVHLVQPPVLGSPEPQLHGGEADARVARHLAQRPASPHGRH